MTGLVAIALALPLVGALIAVVVGDAHVRHVSLLAFPTALAWGVLVAAGDPDPVTLGRLTVDPVVSCAAAGLAFLVGAAPPARRLATSAALSGVTLFAAAAALDDGGVPERPLAAGVALLVVLAALRFRVEHVPLPGATLAIAGGIVVSAGLAIDDPERAAMLVLGGTGAVLVAAAVWATPGVLLFPAVVLATARSVAAVDLEAGDVDLIAAVAVSVGAFGAIGLLVSSDRSWVHRGAIGGVLASVVLLAQDVPDLQRAGLLLAGGATLATVGRHPVALLALAPGIHAVVTAAGQSGELEQAAGGAVIVGLVFAAMAPVLRHGRSATGSSGISAGEGAWTRPSGPALAAAAFGVVPVWDWSGAPMDGYGSAVAVAVGVGLVVGVGCEAALARAGAHRGAKPIDDLATVPAPALAPSPVEPDRPTPRRRVPLRAGDR